MGFVESIYQLFIDHNGYKKADDEYIIIFNALVKLIKAHCRETHNHPEMVAQKIKRISDDILGKDPDLMKSTPEQQCEIHLKDLKQFSKAADN